VPVTVYFLLAEPARSGRTNAKGLLHQGTLEAKPAYRALQHLTSLFDERLDQPKAIEAQFQFLDEGGFPGVKGENAKHQDKPFSAAKAPCPIQVVGVTGSTGDAVAYWVPWRMQEIVKPAKADVRIKGAAIRDPVLVDLLSGEVYGVKSRTEGGAMIIEGVPLADYPMAILSKQSVQRKEEK
jgi:hypothetical protein